jgi:hypothetical protein
MCFYPYPKKKVDLHKILISFQPTEELERKANKARERSNLFTQEEIDLAQRKAEIMSAMFIIT